jgi:phytoene synthase
MNQEIAASYRYAETVARQRARNFYYSFVVLPSVKRLAFCAVYAFMRYCDDISDGTDALEDKRRQLKMWRAQLDAAVQGNLEGSPILPAFRDAVQRFSIPAEYFHWIIDGAEMDLAIERYETFDDLYRYCFHVASAVGLVCLQIFGYTDERAKKLAEQCGIAFQLTNILRDIKEDAGMGRVYLPAEDLRRFRITEDDLDGGTIDARFLELMMYETKRARQYYTQARSLLPLVDADSRPALWAMMAIYEGLLKKIIRHNYDVFSHAIRLSSAEKTAIALRALTMRFLRW